MEEEKPSASAYKKSGVDIDQGNRLITKLASAFASTTRPGVMGEVGSFSGLFDLKQTPYKDPLLVAATDGVGTKLLLALEHDALDALGADLVAMCVNDLVCSGAEPLFFLDYFSCGTLEINQATRVISSIAKHCKLSGCALIGGETAEMPDLYPSGKLDLAGFAVGAVERGQVLGSHRVSHQDRVIGLRSSGPHANGFSLIRSIIKDNPHSPPPLEALLAATTLYPPIVLPIIKQYPISACAHITGGGITENLPRVLPPGITAVLQRPPLPSVFQWIKEVGNISQTEMDRVFNQGIGMVLLAPAASTPKIINDINLKYPTLAEEIGFLEKTADDAAPRVVWSNTPPVVP